MNKRTGLLIFLFIVLVCIALYYYGFVYSFRNFAGTGNYWKPIKEYSINQPADLMQRKLKALVAYYPSVLSFADTSKPYMKDGWFTVFVTLDEKRIEYIFRFNGDTCSWLNNHSSSLFLFVISDKYWEVSSTNLNNTRKDFLETTTLIFEDQVVNHLRYESLLLVNAPGTALPPYVSMRTFLIVPNRFRKLFTLGNCNLLIASALNLRQGNSEAL